MTEYISEENEKTIRNLLASCKKAVPGVEEVSDDNAY